ncbi:MAG TPA: universal stress protein [Acidimicrobiales bacterium]|jgi:nucleotide-binding universal stress UspA family protein
MFKVIVVGADGSPTARRAIEAAAELAAMSEGTLHIVSAYESKNISASDLPAEFKHVNPEGEVQALLQELSFVAKNKGTEPVLHSVTGAPAEAIISTAERLNADLIVVGNKGMRGARRVLGSVPNSVAHGANCSVAIIDTTV